MTITLGRKYDPQRIVGLDIDKKLVEIARKNIRHYMDTRCDMTPDFRKNIPDAFVLFHCSI